MLHRTIIVGLLTIGGILTGMATASAQQSLKLERATPTGSPGTPIQGLGSATLDARLTSTAPTEGFVLAFSYDNSVLEIDNVSFAGTVTSSAGAELVVPEILTNGVTIGVVLDAAAPFGGQTIAAGANQLLARITASSIIILTAPAQVTTALQFTDGVLNNPPLDNLIVQGGLAIAAPALGLDDTGAELTIIAPPPDSLTIENTSGSSQTGVDTCVPITLNNQSGAVQGFVLAIQHDPAVITLEDINLNGTVSQTVGAEFQATETLANGGTLGVVLDFTSPFNGQTIPVGAANHIANFCYSCVTENKFFVGQSVPPSQPTNLTFVDGVFGTPPLSNVIVVAGLSLPPTLFNGVFTCLPFGPNPVQDTKFFCGPRGYEGTENPLNNPAPPIEGTIGSEVEICLFYCDPTDNLQGLQIAICYDCDLEIEGFDITGSIFDEVGAEFVNFNSTDGGSFTSSDDDDDDDDDDGPNPGQCEFVLGILLDALPPFDNQTVPPTSVPLLIGCIRAEIDSSASCGSCLSVEFCDGITGGGNVEIENIAIIDFQSIQGFEKFGCAVCVVPVQIFQRGDCNSDDKVDLADAAKILGWQFQGESIDCPDACDANDDGKINLADSVFLMHYLFKFGATPPNPGPINDGPDPEGEDPDDLPECMSGDSTCQWISPESGANRKGFA